MRGRLVPAWTVTVCVIGRWRGQRRLRERWLGRGGGSCEADDAGHTGGEASCEKPPAAGVLEHLTWSFRKMRAHRADCPWSGADCIHGRVPATRAGIDLQPCPDRSATEPRPTRCRRRRARTAVRWASWRPRSAQAVDYPVHVTERDGDSETSDTPQHRYTAELAGEIERAWQETWAGSGTFNVPNPVGSLASAGRSAGSRGQDVRAGHVPVPVG